MNAVMLLEPGGPEVLHGGERSLESLAVRGHLVNFGQSSGAVEPFAVSRPVEKSSTLSISGSTILIP